MIPIYQTNTSVPGGNCFQACVASIFELPLDEVPFFLDGAAGDSRWTQEQWDAVREFAQVHGKTALWIDDEEPEGVKKLETSNLYYIAIGPGSVSQFGHCVVMQAGEFIHDPTPSGKFLTGEPWLYIFFAGT